MILKLQNIQWILQGGKNQSLNLEFRSNLIRFANLLYYNGKAVLLIRNPFSAILSMFRHRHFGFHSTSNLALKEDILGVFYVEKTSLYFTEKFQKFANRAIEKWSTIIEDWVSLGDVVVVHHEDVLEDKIKEMRRILDFLRVKLEASRMNCLEFGNVDIFKRKSRSLPKSPFTRTLNKKIKNHIDRANDLLLKFKHPGIPYNKYKLYH